MIGYSLAEAGLSECARDAGCSADLNREVLLILLQGMGLLFLVIWTPILLVFTVRLLHTTTRHRLPWLLALWALPVVGAVLWFSLRPDESIRD